MTRMMMMMMMMMMTAAAATTTTTIMMMMIMTHINRHARARERRVIMSNGKGVPLQQQVLLLCSSSRASRLSGRR